MASQATDNFNRANTGTLGANWTNDTTTGATWEISSNTAIPTSPVTNDSMAYYTGISWGNDQYSQAVLSVTGANGAQSGVGLVLRGSGNPEATGNAYVAAISNVSPTLFMSKFVSGTYTLVSSSSLTYTNGDTFEFDVIGTNFFFQHSGLVVASFGTDSSISSGSPGLWLSGSTAAASTFADNWQGGNFTETGSSSFSIVSHLIQGSTNSNGFTSTSINTTGADEIIFFVGANDNTPTVSDSNSNTWSAIGNTLVGDNIAAFHCHNPTVGAGHTFTVTATSKSPCIAVIAISGTNSSPVDQNFGTGISGGVTSWPAPWVMQKAYEFYICAMVYGTGTYTLTPNNSFTILDQDDGVVGNHLGLVTAYNNNNTSSDVLNTSAFTISSNVSTGYDAYIVSLVAAPAAAPTAPLLQKRARDPWNIGRDWAIFR